MAVKVISYGALSDYEQDANGLTFFGAGNTATGWHSAQAISQPSILDIAFSKIFGRPAPQPELEAATGLKVHYRTGDDAAPASAAGDKYNVFGGHQQDGVHNASGTNANRASWSVDYSFFDNDGDFWGATIKVDIDPTARKDFLTFRYDDDVDMFVAKDKNGTLRFLETGQGNGTEKGEVLQDSINLMFFANLIDNDGNAKNGFQAWDMEHGQFDFEISQVVNGICGTGIGAYTVATGVTVNVGEMLIPDLV